MDQSRVVVLHTPARRVVVSSGEPKRAVAIGVRGPQGPVGPSSPGVTYVHEQLVPSTTWTITHNLGQFPSVTVVDSAGTTVIGRIDYISANQIVLTFSHSFGGKAYLN